MMVLLFFQSYIFMNIKSYNENFYYFYSLWKEVVFISLGFFIIIKRDIFFNAIKNKFLIKYLLMIIALSLYGIVIGFLKGYGLFNIFVGARDIMLPLFFFYIFSTFDMDSKNIKYINYSLVVIFLIHTIYGSYSYLTFDGDPSKLWFYDIYSNVEEGVGFEGVNYIRNDKLRASGMFTSPIEYSLSLVLLLYVSIYYIIFHKSFSSKAVFFLISIFFTIGIYISQVRTSFIVFLIGFLIFLIVFKTNIKISYKKFTSAFIPISIVLVSLIYLSMNISEFLVDESSLGRLKQYGESYILLSSSIVGYGFGNIGTKGEFAFDSNVIISLLAFGWIGGIIYLGLYISILFNLISKVKLIYSSNTDIHFKVLYLSLISYYPCSFYFFAFQYTIPSGTNYFVLISSGILIKKLLDLEKITTISNDIQTFSKTIIPKDENNSLT